MPSSGARSGTPPKRPAPSGDGVVASDMVRLRCRHLTKKSAAVSGKKTMWWCDECQSFQQKSTHA